MIDIIVLDLDKTLLKDDNTISAGTIEALRKCKENGKHIVFATARPMTLTKKVVPEEFTRGYCICSNGAEVYRDLKIINQNLISESSISRLFEFFQCQAPDMPLVMVAEEKVLSNRNLDSFIHSKFFGMGVSYEIVDYKENSLRWAEKIFFDVNQMGGLEKVKNNLPEDCTLTTSYGILGEITHRNAIKLDALNYVLDQLGFTLDHVIAFGDDMSDIGIVSQSGIGVAMENAIYEIKRTADLITDSNNADGVANILKKLA